MRIIAGKYRSRILRAPGKLPLRPTSDRLRETLFNVLGPSVEDSLFLDLYAGTGAVGLEAVSRGAREVIFVESHAGAARLIRENLAAFEIDTGVALIEADIERALDKISAGRILADFIFLDPPYARAEECLRTLEYLDASHLVAPRGRVIVEHDRKTEMPQRLDRLECVRLLEQGDAALSFYRLAAAA